MRFCQLVGRRDLSALVSFSGDNVVAVTNHMISGDHRAVELGLLQYMWEHVPKPRIRVPRALTGTIDPLASSAIRWRRPVGLCNWAREGQFFQSIRCDTGLSKSEIFFSEESNS